MRGSASLYQRHRFPRGIIQHAVWLCQRSNLSARDIEDLPAERGIAVSYESIRLWCIKPGPRHARRLKRRHPGYGDTFCIDAVFVKIRGRQHDLWRTVGQDGEVCVSSGTKGRQAQRFLDVHSVVHNLFNLGRHLVSAKHYRAFRQRAFASCECATGP